MNPLPSLAQLAALARRIPGIIWVIVLAGALATAAIWAIFHAGVQHGEQKVQRRAVADSVVHVAAALDSVRQRSDSIGRVVRRVQSSADSGRAATRAIIAAHLEATPPEVVQAVSAQLERDSLANVTHVAHEGSLLAERPIVEKRDSLRVNQAAIGVPEPDSHWKAYVAGGALLGAGVMITILHFAR